MPLRTFACSVVAALALTAPAAGAEERPGLPTTGPVLAGSGVAWAQPSGDAETIRLWEGGRIRTLYSERTLYRFGSLAASDAALAFTRTFAPCPACALAEEVWAGPREGPFRPLAPPSRCYLPWATNQVDVGGTRAAFERNDCAAGRRAVLVADVRARRPPDVYRDVFVGRACCTGVHVAGRFAAWTDGWGSRVVVYDLEHERVAYVAYVGSRDAPGAFDVQEDGKVVVSTGEGLVWFSPTEPRAHTIRLATRAPSSVPIRQIVRLADDRVAVLRYEDDRAADLRVVDLAGRARRVVRFDARTLPVSTFDFDGTRLTWASATFRATRQDCPGGRVGACITRADGVLRIRLALGIAPARTLLRFPFTDVPLASLVPGF